MLCSTDSADIIFGISGSLVKYPYVSIVRGLNPNLSIYRSIISDNTISGRILTSYLIRYDFGISGIGSCVISSPAALILIVNSDTGL